MLITLLCILFSKNLSFNSLTLPILFEWYCQHPFLFLFAISETFQYTVNVKRLKEQTNEKY